MSAHALAVISLARFGRSVALSVAGSAMGKGRKKGAKAAAARPPDDDDALLDAAIAESNAERAKMEAEATKEEQPSSSVHPVGQAALGHAALSMQEVVAKLDAVPVFHVVGTDDKLMVPTNDSYDSGGKGGGEACGCWYFDHADAELQLSGLQRANAEGVTLAIEPTPLGTAFALSEGWSAVPEGTLLRLQASHAVLASLPEPPEPLPPALRERFNHRTGAIPAFMLEGYRTPRGHTPVYLDAPTLLQSWQRDTGKGKGQMPDVSVLDLRLLIARMLSQEDDWKAVCFVPDPNALELARKLGRESGDEPPALA